MAGTVDSESPEVGGALTRTTYHQSSPTTRGRHHERTRHQQRRTKDADWFLGGLGQQGSTILSTQGSIRKDDSGAWFFVVDITGPDGKRKQLKRRGFETKRAAQAALTALQADKQRGVLVVPRRATLGKFLLDDWLPARRVTLRSSTAASYEQLIRNYIVPTIGGVRLQAVDGSMLNRLYGELLTSGRTTVRRNAGAGLSPKTVRNLHGVLSRAFRDGVRWGTCSATRVTPRIRPGALVRR